MTTTQPQTRPLEGNRKALAEFAANAQLSPTKVRNIEIGACAEDAKRLSSHDLDAGMRMHAIMDYDINALAEDKFREFLETSAYKYARLDQGTTTKTKQTTIDSMFQKLKTPTKSEAQVRDVIDVATSGSQSTEATATKSQAPEVIDLEKTDSPPPKSTNAKKRARAEMNLSYLETEHIPNGTRMDSCDVVRRKIRNFIDSGAMNITEFCRTIGVTNHSYNVFIHQRGPYKGMNSNTYDNAWEFFAKREKAGLPMPKKPKLTPAQAKEEGLPDLSDVHLEGEEDDSVPVYDTPAEVRRKIQAHLKRPGVTQAQFCRDLRAQYHTEKGNRPIQGTQLTRFRESKGVDGGNINVVFYAAYCYFEKLRIKTDKPKTKHRKNMEIIYGGKGGFDTKKKPNHAFFTAIDSGEYMTVDQYGQNHIHG